MLIWELIASLELTTRQGYEYKTFRLKIDSDCCPSPINFTSRRRGNLPASAQSFKICHLLEPEGDVRAWFLPREGLLIGFRHSQLSAWSGLYEGPRSRVPFLRMMFP